MVANHLDPGQPPPDKALAAIPTPRAAPPVQPLQPGADRAAVELCVLLDGARVAVAHELREQPCSEPERIPG